MPLLGLLDRRSRQQSGPARTWEECRLSIDRRRLLGVAGSAAALAFPAIGRAQSRYPDRPVRVVVPYPPGGGTDTWARMVIEGLQAELGQPVVIENRGGSSGLIGSDIVAKATPDGYTLLYNITTLVQAPVVLKRFPYDPINDFAFIGRLGTTAITFAVGPSVPESVKTLAGLRRLGAGTAAGLRQLRAGQHWPRLRRPAGRGDEAATSRRSPIAARRRCCRTSWPAASMAVSTAPSSRARCSRPGGCGRWRPAGRTACPRWPTACRR